MKKKIFLINLIKIVYFLITNYTDFIFQNIQVYQKIILINLNPIIRFFFNYKIFSYL